MVNNHTAGEPPKKLDICLMPNYINAMERERLFSLIATIRDKVNKFIMRQLRERGIKDIAPAYGGIFFQLFRNSELTMGEIARLISRDKSTVTALVDNLVALGYAEKRSDSSDHRVTRIRLTEKGKSFEGEFRAISKNSISRAFGGFSDAEKEELIRLLMRVEENL